ncbi:MAG: NADH-quinone oxidoreductase subunit K [Candidatus Micrarchaeaceae archaeon]
MIWYLAIAIAIFSFSLAGVAVERNLIAIIIGIEMMLAAATVLLVGSASYFPSPNSSWLVLLIAIWAIAATEAIILIAFYVNLKEKGIGFDVSKASELKW